MSEIRNWLSIALVVGLLVLMALFAPASRQAPPRAAPVDPAITGTPPEIIAIKATRSIPEQTSELKKLLARVGPVATQEAMLRAGLPFTGETHLLVHTIGDYIYTTYGLKGLSMCRDYFLSACYHGFIIDVLEGSGMQGVVEAIESCKQAAPGVLSQCSHAAGHGFVAWQDYNLVKGLVMCDELGAQVAGFPAFNCYDGAFMENVWGVHNGKPSEKRWVKPEVDIYYPCTDTRIADKYLSACWGNQATLMYQHYKADLKKTAEACDGVTQPPYKEMCYNNFARQIHPLTEGKRDKVLSLCANATGEHWREYCVLTNVTAGWSVGDRVMPFLVCNGATGTMRSECFDRLVSLIHFDYAALPSEEARYCGMIDDVTRAEACKNYRSPPSR